MITLAVLTVVQDGYDTLLNDAFDFEVGQRETRSYDINDKSIVHIRM